MNARITKFIAVLIIRNVVYITANRRSVTFITVGVVLLQERWQYQRRMTLALLSSREATIATLWTLLPILFSVPCASFLSVSLFFSAAAVLMGVLRASVESKLPGIPARSASNRSRPWSTSVTCEGYWIFTCFAPRRRKAARGRESWETQRHTYREPVSMSNRSVGTDVVDATCDVSSVITKWTNVSSVHQKSLRKAWYGKWLRGWINLKLFMTRLGKRTKPS